ncbi:MAG: 30S ribosomal protein S4e [Candidatus Thorarchaeota archaeon]
MGSKGASKHRKRFTAPMTYPIPRKHYKFTIKGTPSGHLTERSIPLSIVLRNILDLAETTREADRIVRSGAIAVDTVIRRDPRFAIGPMDILSIPEIGNHYRATPFEGKRRLFLVEIPDTASNWKLCKVIGKNTIHQGRLQINLHDGRSIQSTEEDDKSLREIAVGDTLKISLPEQEIQEHIPLQTGAWGVIEDGSNIGKNGKLTELEKRIGKNRSIAVLECDDETVVRTSLEYVFVIGKEKPIIEVPTAKQEATLPDTPEETEENTGEINE